MATRDEQEYPSDDSPTRRAVPDDAGETVRGPSIGQKFFGRFRLEQMVGQGGMGVVWRARDEELGETVALKLLPAVVAADPVAVDDLKEETRRARRLRHASIVSVFDFVRDGLQAAVSMEFVDGGTLAQYRLAQPDKILTMDKLAPLVARLCAALDYAHREAKVVHRDLKPSNLLITRDGQLKVTDFGIARSLSETTTRLTGRAGGASGTLLYMSPQQLNGEKATPADDIYALGATLYDLLTGKPPFYTGDITHQILHNAPVPLAERCAALGYQGPHLSEHWERTILRCLDKQAARRPKSAAEVAELLRLGESAKPSVSAPAAKPPASLRYPVKGQKWEEIEEPVVSSVHYPNPDRRKKSGPSTWVDYGVIVLLFGGIVAYFLGYTPFPRPWAVVPTAGAQPLQTEAGATLPADAPGSQPAANGGGMAGKKSVAASQTPSKAGPAQSVAEPVPNLTGSTASGPVFAAAGTDRPVRTDPTAASPVTGSVRLAVSPGHAVAYLDGSPTGLPVPLSLPQLAAGRHVLILRAPGYVEQKLEFAVEPGRLTDLGNQRLIAGAGVLVIDSQPSFLGFELQDEGGKSRRGVTPWDDNRLPVGVYTLTVMRPGGVEKVVRTITIEDQKRLRVMADFSRGEVNVSIHGSPVPAALPVGSPSLVSRPVAATTGRVRLEVSGPADYELLVNGIEFAPPPGVSAVVSLPANESLDIEIRAAGYQPARQTRTLRVDTEEVLRFQLEPLRPAGENRPVRPGSAAVTSPANTGPAVAPAIPVVNPASAAANTATGRAPVHRNARLVRSVQPDYPIALRPRKIEGTVTVRLTVLPSGRVGKVEVLSSPDPKLTAAVQDALARFIYEPATQDGQPVPQEKMMSFEFRL